MTQPLATALVTVSGIGVDVHGRTSDLYFTTTAEAGAVFEPAVALAAHYLGPDAVVLDVGASIGLVSGALGQILTQGRVVAFEPEPRALECLRQTVAAHDGLVSVVPKAVSDHESIERFHQDPNGTAWGSLSEREPYVEVPVTTIDATVAELGLSRVDLIKVDVEGFELGVLAGAATTIADHQPLLVVELNPYCLWRHGRTLPQDLVEAMLAITPHVVAVRSDASIQPVQGRAIDDLLYELGTTGGLADLVASPEPLDLDAALAPYHSGNASAGSADLPPIPEDPPATPAVWDPRDDMRRLNRAVSWRLRQLSDRARGKRGRR